MNYTVALFVFVGISACSPAPVRDSDDNDGFTVAARSWEGTALSGMKSAWGAPSVVIREASVETTGTVVWKYSQKKGSIYNGAFIPTNNAYCSVTVHHDEKGAITGIDVISSKRCEDRFEPILQNLTHR